MVVLKELIFNSFYLKELFGGLENGNCFLTVSTWEGMVVLKELIFNSFYFGRVWWS